MPNLKRKAAYLKGKMTTGENGTLVKLKVKPNSILPIFAITTTLIGFLITIIAMSNAQDNLFFILLGSVCIALGMIYYPMSIWLKNRLRNKMVQYLDLSKI
jgi:1,4-dihydroxy-2-naphthoate octaprenyltransferase